MSSSESESLAYTVAMTADRNVLDAVRHAQAQWASERHAADERRRAAVVEALSSGVSLTEVGKAMGLTRARVSQIRDGVR